MNLYKQLGKINILKNNLNRNDNRNNCRVNRSSSKIRANIYKINSNVISYSKISSTSLIIKSWLNIIEGNKNRENSFDANR